MKKSKVSQATLFQSWGHPAQASSSRNPNLNRLETNSCQPQNGVYSAFDPNDIVDLGDEDDDDELLAAADGIAPFDESNFRTSGGQTNAICNIPCEPDEIEVIPGFDLEAGNVWIYPTNYPIRNYQYDIVEQALFKNTLVTLPTGLGKTFIAAVVMYNFYRWYPQGKVIFMAPTKPLVAQQIEACFNIMGIPQSDTAEMTGNMAPNKRQSLWQSRRVFFLTPQVLQNDLNRGSCKAEEVVLLVADEAHKALGNHAYCQVVREISGYIRNFRVLALSATPGDDLEVLEGVVSRLFCQRALWQRDPQRVTKFLLLSARDQFRKRMNEQGGLDRNQQSRIEGDFAMCISLYHAYELLLQHGILSFFNFIKGIMDGTKGMARAKTEITKNHEFSQLMVELQEEIEPPMENSANESLLFSQFSPRRRALMNVPKPSATFKSHPKLMKLKEIVLEHFEKFQDKSGANVRGVATRVMIFSQYRDSVNEIAAMLAQHKPLVRVMSFIGQQSTGKSSRGLTQKEQLQVVQRFRQGGYNTLVATCVGEEGLDIGEVDLIVCFDAHASPIRLVQRMGRTGRKRDGRIVVLVTEGKEEQVYMRSQRSKKSIHKAVTQAAKSFDLYRDNHRMVPRQLKPAVLKMEMTVGKFQAQGKGKKKGRPSDGANIKNFTSKSATTTSKKSDGFLTYEELVYWQEHFKLPDHEAGLSPPLSVTKRSRRSLSEAKKPVTQPSLTEWLPWQTTLNPVKAVTHSRRTEHLVELLEFTELHGARGDEDESYDLEMMSFLNEEDILKPGESDGSVAEVRSCEIDGDCGRNEGTSKIAKKGKKTRKKLHMGEEGTEAKDDGEKVRKEDGDGGTTAKKNTKGVKKRSPENRARWKEFLKQFDNKDEDFESDGGNAVDGSDENIAVENDLQKQDDTSLENDLPDVGEFSEVDLYTTDAKLDKPRLQQELPLGKTNNTPIPVEQAEHGLESEGGNHSDAASDEFSSLFPTTAPDFHGFNPSFKLQQTRFASTMASVPTPPSLDALDRISLPSASVDLDEMNMKTEEEAQEPRKNLHEKVDTFVTSGAVSPKARYGEDSLMEPFLMSDFLEEDGDATTEIEANEGNTLKCGGFESNDRNSSTPKSTSKTCVGSSAQVHVNEVSQDEMQNQGSRICGNQNSAYNVDTFEANIHEAQNSREVTKDDNTTEHNMRGKLKDADSKAVAQNDFGVGVWSGSPVHEFNERGDDEGLLQEASAFAEAFFTDETDDDAFTNMTLPGDDNVYEGETENDLGKPAAGQELFFECERTNRMPCEVKDKEGSRTKCKLQSLAPACESRASEANVPGELVIDLRTSISKLNAFQRSSTDRETAATMGGKVTRDRESDSTRKQTFSKEFKRCLTEGALRMEAAQALPAHEVCTRDEHSSATAFHSDKVVFDGSRNSVVVPPLSKTISPSKLSMNAKQHQGASRDGWRSRDGLCSWDGDGQMPERESYLDEVRNRAKAENRNNNSGNNVGSNTGNSVGKDSGNSDGSNTGSNAAGTTGSNTGINVGNNTSNNDAHNVCRSPLPKKFKLSRKRTSPKDKGMLATKAQSSYLPGNQARSLDFDSSNSLNVTEDNSCGSNIDGTKVNRSSRDIAFRDSEMTVEQPHSVDTAPNGTSVDCEDDSANLSNLRTQNGAVVAVMESDNEQDDEDDVIRPVGKAVSLRRRALSSPCSQEGFKRPANPGKQPDNHPRCVSSRNLQLGSESDEEFEVDKSAQSRPQSVKNPRVKPSVKKRKSLEIGAKQGTRKSVDSTRQQKNNNRPRKNHFLDDEAELSGSDFNDFSSDEAEDGDEDEMDSFIDDSTQLTQRTPSTSAKPRHASSPADMMAVYRQSLQSPLCGALNFQTPVFHKQRNKYKMVYKYRNIDEESESASEAEETYESESVLENEVEDEGENEARTPYEDEAETRHENEVHTRCGRKVLRKPGNENAKTKFHSHADKSFEESQIGRPVKRMKRKRILDDTFDDEVSPKLSKQRNLSETSNKENSIEKNMMDVPAFNRAYASVPATETAQQRKNDAFGNFSAKSTGSESKLHSEFVKSSDVLADNRHFHGNNAVLQRSVGNRESMRKSGSFLAEWNNDVSDSELLVAFEGEGVKASSVQNPPRNDIFQDQDLKEIAVAMEMTDDDVVMEINELPTFSLGFDFLSEAIFANNASAGDINSSKDNAVTFTERTNENYGVKPNFATSQGSRESIDPHRTEHFTKIAQCSEKTSERSPQLVNNAQMGNKDRAVGASCQVSNSTSFAAQKATKPNILNENSVSSDRTDVSNNALSLTRQTKSKAQSDGQRRVPDAQAKLQVVTPSCRPNPLVTRPAISPLLTSSQKDKGKTIILVDTREISSSQVVSLLRLKHNIKAEVCQLTSCDYIVSNRMAVKRKTASDVANGANSSKLVECMRRMCDLYDRPCLIIEKDRVKPGETDKSFIKTKAYIFTLASIAQTHVKLMFSDSQEETASLLTELANIETKKGTAITASTALSKEREQIFRVVASIPRVSYIAALNLCSAYSTLHEIINSTAVELERRTPGLSSPRAAEIHKYLRHKFNPEMVPLKI